MEIRKGEEKLEIKEEVEIKLSKGEREREEGKKRGRKGKGENIEQEEIKKEQDKFFIDVAQDQVAKEMISKLLTDANNKVLGRSIILKDLVLFALPKLTSKDVEQIQNNTLSNMERIEKQRLEYNAKNKTNLDLGEYLVTVKNILREGK